MIKAIFFIADTIQRGKKVVYVYPRQEHKENNFDSKEEIKFDHLQNLQEIFIGNFLKNKDFCIFFVNSSFKNKKVGQISTKNFFGFNSDFMTELFSPKENNSNSTLEIRIDDKLFISRSFFPKSQKIELDFREILIY